MEPGWVRLWRAGWDLRLKLSGEISRNFPFFFFCGSFCGSVNIATSSNVQVAEKSK
jgi:hypothetical protein